jgi:hypothetical protein
VLNYPPLVGPSSWEARRYPPQQIALIQSAFSSRLQKGAMRMIPKFYPQRAKTPSDLDDAYALAPATPDVPLRLRIPVIMNGQTVPS